MLSYPVGGSNHGRGCAPKRVVNWQLRFLAEQEEVGRKPGGSVKRIVIRLHKLREVLWPLGLLFRGQGSKQIMQRAIESLALRFATGVVWSGPGLLDAIELTQGFHQLRLKVPTLVTVDFLGYPVSLEPLVNQHLGHCPCLLVARRYGLGELRENIGENFLAHR